MTPAETPTAKARAKVEEVLADYRHRLSGVIEPPAAVERLWPTRKLRTALTRWQDTTVEDALTRVRTRIDQFDPATLTAGELKSAALLLLDEAGAVPK